MRGHLQGAVDLTEGRQDPALASSHFSLYLPNMETQATVDYFSLISSTIAEDIFGFL
jgi:hypothetical protein